MQVCFLLSNNFYLFSFLSGISIFLIIINPANLKLKNPLYLFLFLIFILSFLFDAKSFIATGVLLIALVTEYLNKNLYSNTQINKIGDYSYSIYIIQEIIISSSIKISSYSYKFFNLNNDLIFYIFNLCSISYLVIIAGFILGKLIEKPALNILMKNSN